MGALMFAAFGNFIYYARTGSLTQSKRETTLLMRTPQEVSSSGCRSGRRPAARARASFILALLTVGTLINYLDRTVISAAAPLMTKELGLTAVAMGIVFSAFSWTYAAAQIPGGILLDRIGVRLTYFLSVTIWSAFTLLQGLTTNLWSLIACRMGLGVAEAPALPSNSRVLGTWFPQARARSATGVLFDRPVFRPRVPEPLLFWIAGAFGWRALAHHRRRGRHSFGFVWYALYRDPHESRANQAELDYHSPAAASPVHPACGSNGVTSLPDAAAADSRRIDRTVREQFHAGVLPHLVPTYLAHGTPDGLDQGRILHGPALHRRLRRRHDRRAVLGSAPAPHGLRERRAQVADHRRAAARLDHRDREFRDGRYTGHHRHVGGVLRAGHVQPRLDAANRRGTERNSWA